jgi:hypothetical protein
MDESEGGVMADPYDIIMEAGDQEWTDCGSKGKHCNWPLPCDACTDRGDWEYHRRIDESLMEEE